MSTSMKFKNLTLIKNEIIQAIDSNQEIKRYIKYLSNSPLSSRAKLDNGEFINQPDIEESLIGLSKNIVPCMYYQEVLEEDKVIIFIYCYKGDLSKKVMGDNLINIDIICPTRKDFLEELGEQRTITIANKICSVLDDVKLNKGLTTLSFVDYECGRISKDAEYSILSLQSIISSSNMRVR